jgi:hypothetical protein
MELSSTVPKTKALKIAGMVMLSPQSLGCVATEEKCEKKVVYNANCRSGWKSGLKSPLPSLGGHDPVFSIPTPTNLD